ncbi:MAG: winged helix-turn-helix domain-containing protein [Methylococcales bacterium]
MIYHFADLTLNIERRQLQRGNEIIKLTKLSFKVLTTLLSGSPNIIDHNELVNNVWGENRIITPENITQRIMMLRQSLGDDASKPQYIESIHGVGFKIIPTVTFTDTEQTIELPLSTIPNHRQSVNRRKISWVQILSSITAIVVLFILLQPLIFNQPADKSLNSNKTKQVPLSNTLQQKATIAVLPFVNMSADPKQDYFSDGISEEILNSLTQIDNLKVISRTSSFSFKNKKLSLLEVANILGVKNILEGSVRRDGNKIRITAQLIDATTDTHLWSKTYDREFSDIFSLQDEISIAIVNSLKNTLNIDLVKIPSVLSSISPEAYDLYLQGLKDLHVLTFESLDQAVNNFKAALVIEPNFLQAKIKLAFTFIHQFTTGSRYDSEILDTADLLIKEVLEIDSKHALAYTIRSKIAGVKGKDKLSEQYMKHAYRLNPNNVEIIFNYVRKYGFEMSEEKAKYLFNYAKQLDPLNANIPYYYAFYLQDTLQAYAEAETAYKQAIKINPEVGDYTFFLSWLNSRYLGNIVAAIHYSKITQTKDKDDPDEPRFLSGYYLSLGDGPKALSYAKQSINLIANNADAIDAKVNALIYLGENDKALKLIKDTLENPDTVYRRISKSKLTSRGVHLLLINNKLNKAEELIAEYIPEILALVDAPQPKSLAEVGDRKGIAALAAVYQAQKNVEKAKRLANRFKLHDEALYSKRQVRLNGLDLLRLAYVSAIRGNSDKTLDYLEASIDDGNLHDWRSNILQEPVFISLQKHPRFIALIERIEAEMVRQKALLNEKKSNEL